MSDADTPLTVVVVAAAGKRPIITGDDHGLTAFVNPTITQWETTRGAATTIVFLLDSQTANRRKT